MKNSRSIMVAGLLAAVLAVPVLPTAADAKDDRGNHHYRRNEHDGKWRGDHGKR